jgi:hypothetical protein
MTAVCRPSLWLARGYVGGHCASTPPTFAREWLNSEAHPRDILIRIADHPINCITELLPWNWHPTAFVADAA